MLCRWQIDTGSALLEVIFNISVNARTVDMESLRAVGMITLQLFKRKTLSEVSSSLISKYQCAILDACLYEAGHPLGVSL